jgi:hypothetical protein
MPSPASLQLEADLALGREAGVYEGEATLGAIESIMRAHSSIPGRKVVVLFTTSWFSGRRPDLMDKYMVPLRQLSQLGFSVWTVDTKGARGGAGESQSYFGMLAKETGGETVRVAVDLTSAFRDAAERLSCYYLLSLPVPRGTEPGTLSRGIVVALDTKRRPDLWKYEVRAPTHVTLLDPRERIERERVSALVSPGDFGRPPVAAQLGFPVREGNVEVLPARFRVPLGALAWSPEPGGGYVARLLFDGTVHRDNGAGVDTVCSFGAEKGGALTLKLSRPPAENSRSGLAIELACPAKKDGLHTARGVVTDVEAGHAGAGRSTMVFRRGGAAELEASAPRVEAASGLDYVWRPGQGTAKRDGARDAGRLVAPGAPADVSDRLYFRYVLCGPDRAALATGVRNAIVAPGAGGKETTVLAFPGDALEVIGAPPASTGPFCAQVRLRLDEFSLEPGSYVFAVDRAGGGRIVDAPFALR